MKKRTRKENVILNIGIGYFSQVATLILQFVGRHIFIRFLSVEYLGINGLYSNVFSLLSLAELGMGNVAVFMLYQPVAEDKKQQIAALVKFFKKAYYMIACAIFILGLLLVPFLHYFIKSNLSNNDLIKYYLLYLIGTIASYLAAHKIALLNANQDVRIQKIITLIISIAQQIVQITVLCIFSNYTLYLVIQIAASFLTAFFINIVVSRRYTYLAQPVGEVVIDKTKILNDIFSTALYKIGTVVINSTDNILISSLVSVVAVGMYSNYNMVVIALQMFISIITNALIYSIGNLNTDKNQQKMFETFGEMLFGYHFVAALGAILLWNVLNDVITLWIGSGYLIENSVVLIIVLNFYSTNAISPIWMFREATGMFAKVKYIMLCRAALNIVFSILLGRIYGTYGILLATLISLLLTSFWYEPKLLFKTAFSQPVSMYWKDQIRYGVLTIFSAIVNTNIIAQISTEKTSILNLFFKAFVCCAVTVFFFTIGNWKHTKRILKALGPQIKRYMRR